MSCDEALKLHSLQCIPNLLCVLVQGCIVLQMLYWYKLGGTHAMGFFAGLFERQRMLCPYINLEVLLEEVILIQKGKVIMRYVCLILFPVVNNILLYANLK